MDLSDDIRFILTAALQAPSGDNNQPWRWVVKGNILELHYNVADQRGGESPFNSNADYIALGATVENAVIAASGREYEVRVSVESDHATCFATLTLLPNPTLTPSPLASVLFSRKTNRRPFSREPLSETELSALKNACAPLTLHLVTDSPTIRHIAQVSAVYDSLIFSNRLVHHNFFSQINWTERQDRHLRTGFYYPTLGAPLHIETLFRALRHWPLLRVLDVFGFSRIISWHNERVYRQAGAHFVLEMASDTPKDYFEAGRIVERLWLTATKLGLSLQPMNGVAYLLPSIKGSKARFFTPSEKTLIDDTSKKLHMLVQAPGAIAFVGRLGKATAPTVRTRRRYLEDVVAIESTS